MRFSDDLGLAIRATLHCDRFNRWLDGGHGLEGPAIDVRMISGPKRVARQRQVNRTGVEEARAGETVEAPNRHTGHVGLAEDLLHLGRRGKELATEGDRKGLARSEPIVGPLAECLGDSLAHRLGLIDELLLDPRW